MSLHARYTIVRKIADGGTAEIFLATQHGAQGFEKPVVLKRIFSAFYADPQFRNMLIDEALIAMSLNHSNIVQVLDLGESDGQYVMALELVDGWTLDTLLRRTRALAAGVPPALALYLAAEVGRALAYAHAKSGPDGRPLGIVHRDISPHNVLISDQGEVKLTDFGIAKAQNRREKSLGNLIKGKIAFMSPEQAAGGPLDARSDLFSLGTMLYVMLCRRFPFDAPTDLEVLLLVKSGEYVAPEVARPGMSPEIYRVLRRALSRNPDERYQRAEDMLLDVEQVMRVAFRAVGQTELKRWLQELSEQDGVPALTRLAEAHPVAAHAATDVATMTQLETDVVTDEPTLVETDISSEPVAVPLELRGENRAAVPAATAADQEAQRALHLSGTDPEARGSADPPGVQRATGGTSPAPAPLRKSSPGFPAPGGGRAPRPHATPRATIDGVPVAAPSAGSGAVPPPPPAKALATGRRNPPPLPAGARVPTGQHRTLAAAPEAEAAESERSPATTSTEPETPRPVETASAQPSTRAPEPTSAAPQTIAIATLLSATPVGVDRPNGAHSSTAAEEEPTPSPSPSSLASAVVPTRSGAEPSGPASSNSAYSKDAPTAEAVAETTLPVRLPSPTRTRLRSRTYGLAGGAVAVLLIGIGLVVASRRTETTSAPPSSAHVDTPSSVMRPAADEPRRQPVVAAPPPQPATGTAPAPGDTPPGESSPGAAEAAPRKVAQDSPEPERVRVDVAGAAAASQAQPPSPSVATAAAPAAAIQASAPRSGDDDVEATGSRGGPSAAAGRQRIAVLLKSTPSGAEVTSSHRTFGSTPISVRLRPGVRYALTFRMDGYRPLVKRLVVHSDSEREFAVTLKRGSSRQGSASETTAPTDTKPAPRNWWQKMFTR